MTQQITKRPGNPAWVKGCPSPNAAGRSRGFAGVARGIMEATRDGAELIEWALTVWRDESRDHRERFEAFQWLSDRGLGRPIAMLDLHAFLAQGADQGDAVVDSVLNTLSLDDQRALRALYAKAGVTDDLPVIDVETVES